MASIILTGLAGRKYVYTKATVTLDANGAGTVTVTFPSGFISPPSVFIVERLAESGSYSAGSITASGFIITVASSDIVSQDIEVIYIAHEKL